MMQDPYLLFKNIKKARLAAGLSQEELAEKLGVSAKTVSAYETGRAIPPSPTLIRIAEITEVPIDELAGDKNGNGKYQKIEKRLRKLEERVANLEQLMIKFLKKSRL